MPQLSDHYIEVKNLRKVYGQTTVLEDISFEIKEGEFVCFLGPSGCGKTTLLLCLEGSKVQIQVIFLKKANRLLANPHQNVTWVLFSSLTHYFRI